MRERRTEFGTTHRPSGGNGGFASQMGKWQQFVRDKFI